MALQRVLICTMNGLFARFALHSVFIARILSKLDRSRLMYAVAYLLGRLDLGDIAKCVSESVPLAGRFVLGWVDVELSTMNELFL